MPSLQQPSKVEQACDAIQHWILARKLQPGQPMPNEGELAQTLAVSRTVVREALSQLQVLGIIERINGIGIRAGCGDLTAALHRPLQMLSAQHRGLTELMELRTVLELGCATLYFDEIQSRLPQLDAIVHDMAQSTSRRRILELESSLHCTLSGASALTAQLHELIVSYFRREATSAAPDITPAQVADAHRWLIEPLHQGDRALFCERLAEHLRAGLRTLQSVEPSPSPRKTKST
jgi:DNA-binding FadR family transcriptional regulator